MSDQALQNWKKIFKAAAQGKLKVIRENGKIYIEATRAVVDELGIRRPNQSKMIHGMLNGITEQI